MMAKTKTAKKPTKKAAKPFYHVTAVENVEPILTEGLKGSTTPRNRDEEFGEPSICVLVSGNENLTDSIAIHQIWPVQDIEQYAVIRISSAGVTGRIVADEVPERTAPWHRVIQQDCIEPKYLKHVKTRVLNFPGKTAFMLVGELHRKKKWTPQEWEIAERYVDRECVALRRVFEAKQDQRKLTAEEWKKVRPFVHPNVVEEQEAFEATLYRKKGTVKKKAKKKTVQKAALKKKSPKKKVARKKAQRKH